MPRLAHERHDAIAVLAVQLLLGLADNCSGKLLWQATERKGTSLFFEKHDLQFM